VRGGFCGGDRLGRGGLARHLLPLEIGEAAAAFLNFIRLLSHKRKDLLREMELESSLVLAAEGEIRRWAARLTE
jgi:hypothetical protein